MAESPWFDYMGQMHTPEVTPPPPSSPVPPAPTRITAPAGVRAPVVPGPMSTPGTAYPASMTTPAPAQSSSDFALRGPLQVTQNTMEYLGQSAANNAKRVEKALAGGGPRQAIAALKNEADDIGLGSEPAKLYQRSGRNVDKDFQAILEAYGLAGDDRPTEQNITFASMDKDEKAAFLFDTGLKMMALGGAPGSAASSTIGIIGAAMTDSLEEVRKRRARRGDERRELGKLILAEREYQGDQANERARLDLEREKMERRSKEQAAQIAETRRNNLAMERYYMDSLEKKGGANATADMQLFKYFEDMGYSPREAVDEAKKYKSTSRYGEVEWARQQAAEFAQASVRDRMDLEQNRGGLNPPTSQQQSRWFDEVFESTYARLTGQAEKLGFPPPRTGAEFVALSEEQRRAFLDSDVYRDMPPEEQMRLLDEISALQ